MYLTLCKQLFHMLQLCRGCMWQHALQRLLLMHHGRLLACVAENLPQTHSCSKSAQYHLLHCHKKNLLPLTAERCWRVDGVDEYSRDLKCG